MKTDTLINAFGMIDDKLIEEAHKPVHIRKRSYRGLAAAAAVVLCIAMPLPVAVAAGSETAYQALYAAAPAIAQTFKPVQKSCTDHGIRMEVISAETDGSEASVYLSMQDIEADRLDETIDLFDSYGINLPYDNVGHCSFSRYDEAEKTAYFVVHIERMDGKDIKSGKMTFTVHQLIAHKVRTEGFIDEVDLSAVTEADDTFVPDNIYGYSDMYADDGTPVCLRPSDTPLFYAADGAAVTGVGMINGRLHVQLLFADRYTTDDHGFIHLIGGDGEDTEGGSIHFGNYNEYVYDISPEELPNCRLYGEFVSAPPCISGNWEVTFRIDD